MVSSDVALRVAVWYISLLSNFVGSQKELEAYIRLLEIRTDQIVQNYWPEIVVMANELLKRKRLTGPEAIDVFYQAVRFECGKKNL